MDYRPTETPIKRRINHDHFGIITLYGVRHREDSPDPYGRYLLDVEDYNGSTIPRDDWMPTWYDDLVARLPKFDVGDRVQVSEAHPNPQMRGVVATVTRVFYNFFTDKKHNDYGLDCWGDPLITEYGGYLDAADEDEPVTT